MNLTTLKNEAATKIGPLAEKVRKLSRHLAEIQKRASAEAAELVKAEENLARFKGLAGAYLADGHGTFDKYKTGLRKALARLETAVESTRIFERELVPAAKRDVDAARRNLDAAAREFYGRHLPACEAEMAESLAVVVAERDDFCAAFEQLGRDFGTSFRGDPPKAFNARLGDVARRHTGLPWLTFTNPPAAPAPAATGPGAAVLAQPGRVESAPTGEVGPEVKETAPRSPEATTEALGVAAERPGAAACRARVLRRTLATEAPPESAPADLGLPPDADGPDAPDGPEAPPADGQKENPKIAPESA